MEVRMALYITGGYKKGTIRFNILKNLEYKYPKDANNKAMDLKPGSILHNKIIEEVNRRAQASYDVMKRRHPYWNAIDEKLTSYITLDEKETLIKANDVRKPVAVVVPYSYATLETLITYMVTAFLELPYFKYEGVGDEDVIGAALLEKIIEIHCNRFRVGLSLHTNFRDALAYGFGVGSPSWAEKWGWMRRPNPVDGTIAKLDSLLYEGNELLNIDPYLYLPDPSVPIQDVQRGEFVGYIQRSNFMTLYEEEGMSGGDMFNVGYLKNADARSDILYKTDPSNREKKYGGGGRDEATSDTNPIDITYMFMKIVPSDEEWKLGPERYPVKWLFGVAGDEIVVVAKPVNLDHDMFPICINAPEFDGYSLTPISKVEMTFGLQEVVDFLFTSHVTNVRKAVNDMFIVDPFLVNIADFENPAPGKLIRLRRSAWGRGVENVAKQLEVNDVTRTNISDATFVMDVMSRVTGAVDSLQGIMRHSSERRSATEARDTRMSAISRLAKMARITSLMFMHDVGYMFAKHTQQLMSTEMFVRTVGRYQEILQKEYGERALVNIKDILVDTDIEVGDGTINTGEFIDTWKDLFQIMATQPWVGAQFDLVRVFKHIGRMAGARNIDDFENKVKIKPVVTPDADVEDQLKAGNIVPIGGANAGNQGAV
jgi:hypothetical protein